MSAQIRIDELLHALQPVDPAAAKRMTTTLEALASDMACRIAAHYGIATGGARDEGPGFAGICAPFRPVYSDQPFPADFAAYDDGAEEEWACELERLVTPMPPADCAPIWEALGDKGREGVRVRCSNGTLGVIADVGRETVRVEYDMGASGYWTRDHLQTTTETPAADADLAEAAEGDECSACGRASIDCSRAPCGAVMRDREESDLGDVRTSAELPPEDGYRLHTEMVADIARATDPDALGIGVDEVTGFVIRTDYEGNTAEKWVTVWPDPENSSEAEFTRIE